MSVVEAFAPGLFCWVDLVAHDMQRAEGFYQSLFGWETERMDTAGGPPYANFRLGIQTVAGLGQMNDEMRGQGVPPMWNSYISVTDVDHASQRATELGGRVAVGPLQVMNFGKLAFVQDPTGGMVGLWEPQSHIGATQINDAGCFCWNELATRDLQTACDFYAQLFGWTYADNSDSPAPYMVIQCGDRQNGGIMQMTDEWPAEIPPHWTVYFSVESIEAALAQLKQLEGQVHFGPFETPVGPMAVCADAEGASFNLIQVSVNDSDA